MRAADRRQVPVISGPRRRRPRYSLAERVFLAFLAAIVVVPWSVVGVLLVLSEAPS